MSNTVILIPSRLAATRLPNKPLLKINNISIMQIKNGNAQLNETRDVFNHKVSKLNILGDSKTIKWNGRRRFRTI